MGIRNPGHYSFFVSSTTHFLALGGVGETFGEEKDFRSNFRSWDEGLSDLILFLGTIAFQINIS